MSDPGHDRPAVAHPRILNLAWLPHLRETDTSRPPATKPVKPVAVDAAGMNPGFWKADGVDPAANLQKLVDKLLSENKEFKPMRFALVDLSKGKVEFAGNKTTEHTLCASLLKIACLYAAFQLRYDLNVLAQKHPTFNSKELFDAARDAWSDTQVPGKKAEPVRPGDPAKFKIKDKLIFVGGSRVGLTAGSWHSAHKNKHDGAPNLERIFEDSAGAIGDKGVSFRRSADPAKTIDDILFKHVQDKKTKDWHWESRDPNRQLLIDKDAPFLERLFLMIDDSNNAAANSCILDVGFLYIHSAIWQADFFNPRRGGGMWLRLPYGNPVWDGGEAVSYGVQHASAAGMAALMTLLALDRPFGPGFADEMLWLLSKKKNKKAQPGNTIGYVVPNTISIPDVFGSYNYSPVTVSLEQPLPDISYNWNKTYVEIAPKALDRAHSKLGLLVTKSGTNLESDAAYIVRTEGKRTLKYVISICNWEIEKDKNGPKAETRNRLVAGLDRCIVENV